MTIQWKDNRSPTPDYHNAANFHKAMPDLIAFNNPFLERKSGTTGTILVKANTKIGIINSGIHKAFNVGASDVELTNLDLDTGAAFVVGSDYYVYLCDAGTDTEVFKISLNSTYPSGYNATNSRKIGGFHYGYERLSITVADVQQAIVPNSVWDLKFRPKCTPEGMVYVGGGLWVDIYLAAVNEAITFNGGNGYPLLTGTAKSAYGVTPLTGTEGLSGYNFIELARRSNKRLLTLSEWLQAAHGHPAGDQFAGNVSTRGTTGENVALGSISLANVVDCARKLYQWLADFTIQQASTSWAYQDVMSGMHVGQPYLPNATGLSQILAGGYWGDGASAGSRFVYLHGCPWLVYTYFGSRFACDSL